MSFKSQVIEWDVPIEDVQVGVPIGYEVLFALNPSFNIPLYRITTYEEGTAEPQGIFFYSLDGGETWIDFPRGDLGIAFYQAYKMRLVINVSEVGFIFAEKRGTIYRVRPDNKETINFYSISNFDVDGTAFEINRQTGDLYVTGKHQTAYMISSVPDFKPGNNSINLQSNPVGIAIDGTRGVLWQVNRTNVMLKDLSGNLLYSYTLPVEIDHSEFSSSSSSSSQSSSSSSSSSVSSSSSTSLSSSSSSSVSSSSTSSESLLNTSSSSESVGNTSSSSSTSQSSNSSSSTSSSSSSSSGFTSLSTSSSTDDPPRRWRPPTYSTGGRWRPSTGGEGFD